MYYILVEGLSGSGKTRGLLESINQWMGELSKSSREKILLSFHRLIKVMDISDVTDAMKQEKKDDSIDRGYQLLCDILYKTHFEGHASLKYPAELHSTSWRDALIYMLKKWSTTEAAKRTWLLQLDDAQYDPMATRSILRASVDWNNPLREESSKVSPLLNIMIVIACSMTSGVEVRTEDLIQATGLKPQSITMSLGQPALNSLMPQVLKKVGLCSDQPWLSNVLQPWIGGWPIAYFFLEEALRDLNFSGDRPLLLVEAERVYAELLTRLDRYGEAAYASEFGTSSIGVQNLLALALTAVSVSSNAKINCISILQASKGGLFTLHQTPGKECWVEIPLISVALVNKNPEYTVCDPGLLQPFTFGWQQIEDIASTSLTLFINALGISFERVNVEHLRPGALFGPGTADREVKLCRLPWTIPTLHAEQLVSQSGESLPKFNLKRARIELEGKEEDLSRGAVIRAVEGQTLYDYLVFLPGAKGLNLVGQARARTPSNVKGEEPQTTIKSSDITQSGLYDITFGKHHVVEFFSTRPLENPRWVPPPNTVVVHQANFDEVVGPAFKLVIKLHAVVKQMVSFFTLEPHTKTHSV